MSVETSITYTTSDGRQFDDRQEAETHEQWLTDEQERREADRQRGWIGRRRYHWFEQPLSEAERKRDAADKEITRLKPLLAGEKNIGKLIDVCDDISCFGGEYLDSAKEVKAISQGLEEFDKLTPELEEENKDADGHCQYWDVYATNPCGDPTVEGTRFCRAHIDRWCIDCGRHATHDCDGLNGGYVCGMPLCENCQHEHL